jgi:hypothetical protein
LGTPIWLGHPASVCQRLLERLDAFLGEEDERGRMVSYDRVACVAVVGNEDGAHHVFAELAQGLSDEGFTIPAEGSVYWVGEAMQAVDFKDKSPTPEAVVTATKTLARNAARIWRGLSKSSRIRRPDSPGSSTRGGESPGSGTTRNATSQGGTKAQRAAAGRSADRACHPMPTTLTTRSRLVSTRTR